MDKNIPIIFLTSKSQTQDVIDGFFKTSWSILQVFYIFRYFAFGNVPTN